MKESVYCHLGMNFCKIDYVNNRNKYHCYDKELIYQAGMDCYDYGARFYDVSLGRFHTQDAFAEKYLDFTLYQYGANNPIKNVDVNGDSILIWYQNPSNDRSQPDWLSYTWVPGQEYEGNIDFVTDAVAALNHLVENEVGSEVFDFINDPKMLDVNISQVDKKTVFTSTNQYKDKGLDVYWSPDEGLLVNENDQSGIISPAVGLLHELGHFKDHMSNPKRFFDSQYSMQFWNKRYGDPEEKYVIKNIENPACKKLGQPIRDSHDALDIIKVKGPTSTESANRFIWVISK